MNVRKGTSGANVIMSKASVTGMLQLLSQFGVVCKIQDCAEGKHNADGAVNSE